MRLPQLPPVFEPNESRRILEIGGREDVREAVRHANARYFHWDELRRRPAPKGVDLRELWWLVKLSRGQRTRLPLREPGGRAFGFWLPDHALETLHLVDRWAGGHLFADGESARSLPETRDQVIVSSLMEEAIATSQIEGAGTTRAVAKEMLRTKREPRDRGEQMISNSYATIQMLRGTTDRALSRELLFEIQRRMTEGTLDDPSAAGRLRRARDQVVVVDARNDTVLHTPPPAEQLPKRLDALVTFANATEHASGFMHPLVKAAILHFWLAYEHPFVDGNGRTARALIYWFMLKNGYWLFEFLTISRAIMKGQRDYYRSFLHAERDGEDVTYSVLYQLDATKRALEDLRVYLDRRREDQRELAQALRAVPDLNHRQRALLDRLRRHPDEIVTYATHRAAHDVVYLTARSDILELVGRKLLDEVGAGRPRRFVATEDLAEKLMRAPSRRRR